MGLELLAVYGLFMLTVISPGPDFLVTVHVTHKHGVRAGLLCALGIACGLLIHNTYALFGVGYLLTHAAWLLPFLKVAGGLYLLFLGGSILRGVLRSRASTNAESQAAVEPHSSARAFRTGLLINVLNGKAVFCILSFYALMLNDFPFTYRALFAVGAVLGPLTFFSALALTVSHRWVKALMTRYAVWIDGALSLFLLLIGADILWEAVWELL